jgi:hypothetical protein
MRSREPARRDQPGGFEETMSSPRSPAIYVGTRAGLFLYQEGAIAPLSRGLEHVTALASLPGARIAAGTARGEIASFGPDGAQWRCVVSPAAEAITSLLTVPGPEPLLLAGTARGSLLASADLGRTFLPAPAIGPAQAALTLHAVPGRPRSALALLSGHGVLHAADFRTGFELWTSRDGEPLLELCAHPLEGHLWLARTRDRLLRSTDGARAFSPAAGWPADLRPRLLHFSPAPPHPAFAVAWPRPDPPDPSDPSPLWMSRDAGLTFHPIPSRLLDRPRDPSGEITALTSLLDRDAAVVLLASDRGELLEWRRPDLEASLLASDLPPIEILLAVPSPTPLDPSTSGIHLLP